MSSKNKDSSAKEIANVSSISSYDASFAVRALTADKASAEFNPRKAQEWAKKRHEARLRAVTA
ncbi:hypothetical protein [Marinomonas algicola]|uniref:hypothetical protein n=1 Tax=Marinomonas algicola TaxID=2773454 RepID=UPI00174B1F83|nr:hypothetical protein [Marinomonas algicola]